MLSQDVASKTSLSDQFTDAENELINKILIEFAAGAGDAKELEVCKAKLLLAEKEIAALHVKLEKVLKELEKEKDQRMLVHKQMIDLRNKLKLVEDQLLNKSKISPSDKRRITQSSMFTTRYDRADDSDDDDSLTTCFQKDFCRVS